MVAVSPDIRLDGVDSAFLAIVEEAIARVAEGRWSVVAGGEGPQIWIRVVPDDAQTPEQGWKLHLSAGLFSAEDVLRRALPVLLADSAAFKLAASPDALSALNEGHGSFSQVGKFLTIYPSDDAQAVRLAVSLDEATRGLRGPNIPSDRALAPGSLVHYRYGGFGNQHLQTPLGEVVPALVTPDGELVPDRRLPVFRAPEWVEDPFEAAGVVVKAPAATPLVAQRYLITGTLHSTPRGSIHLAVDIEAGSTCVLKRARRDGQLRPDGRDARDALRHEAAVLARLAPDPRFPTPLGLVEHEGDLYLAMDDIEGDTLERRVISASQTGTLPSEADVIRWGREIALALGTIHAAGFIYRDLKSPNVILAQDGGIRLIDFESVHDPDAAHLFTKGTRGYMAPGWADDPPPTIAAEVYALGALLYLAATGAEPSLAPRSEALLDRPIRLLNPAIGPGLASVIACCLAADPADRYESMAAVVAALDEAAHGSGKAEGSADASPEYDETDARAHALAQARRLGETLSAAAKPNPQGPGMVWGSAHHGANGRIARDINTGCAGTLLAVAELADATQDPALKTLVREGAQALRTATQPGGQPVAGLYVGEAGVGTALLRAGQVLGDGDLITAAEERGRFVSSLPFASPDLFNGTAGRLRFHLLLWDETRAPDHLAAAVAAGDALLDAAVSSEGGGLYWVIPEGYDGLTGQANLGYAHGASGIADVLLDLYEATEDDRFLAAARGAASWLARQAVPVLPDQSGFGWPVNEGLPPVSPFWCHGAAGIARFFLHAAKLVLIPNAAELAIGALRSTALGARWAGPTQCHGLAGNIEILLDGYQATGDETWLTEARAHARLLEAFALERASDGLMAYPSESPHTVTPDYMVGFAGVAVCLLRLADPVRRPHQLSRSGFRFRQGEVR